MPRQDEDEDLPFRDCASEAAEPGKPCCGWCGRHRALVVLAALGATFLLGGTLVPWGLRQFVRSGVIAQQVIDSASASGFAAWQDTSKAEPLYYKMSIWNLTNPDQVLAGAKPVMALVGPYVYKEVSVKLNVSWSQSGELVHYWENKHYVFSREDTAPGLSERDQLVNLNVVLLGLKVQLEQALPPLLSMLPAELQQLSWQALLKLVMCRAHLHRSEESLDWHSPFVRRSVHELYWGWEPDPMLHELNQLLGLLGQLAPKLAPLLPKLPEVNPGLESNYTDQRGPEYSSNKHGMSVWQTSNVNSQYTGKDQISRIWQYQYWENQTEVMVCPGGGCPPFEHEWDRAAATAKGWTPMWETSAAGSVQASSGGGFGFGVDESSAPSLFIDTLLRSAELYNRAGERVSDLHQIEMLRFRIRPQDMMNASQWPPNAQYDSYGPSGQLNLTKDAGFPLFVSKPHFFEAAPELAEGVVGMRPGPECDTFIDIEPWSGITMREQKQLQMNVVLEDFALEAPEVSVQGWPSCGADLAADWDGHWNISGPIFVPYTVVSENTQISDKDATTWRDSAQAALDAAKYLEIWANVAAGLCLVAIGGLVGWRWWKARKAASNDENTKQLEALTTPSPLQRLL